MCKIATVKDDQDLCPPEIKILEEFYHSFKGPEWINNRYWLDESESYCSWYGVACDEFNVSTTKLELGNNGLSGVLGAKITEMMSGLTQLEDLDLNGNDIEVWFVFAIFLPFMTYIHSHDIAHLSAF